MADEPEKTSFLKRLTRLPRLRRLPRPTRRNAWLYGAGGLGVVYLLLALVFGVGIYRAGWSGEATRYVSKVMPFPTALVRGSPIWYGSFLEELETRKQYFASFQKVDFNSADGQNRLAFLKAQILDEQINKKLVAQEAKKRKITVSEKEVDAKYKEIVDANGGEEKVKEILRKYYNWDPREFKKRIHEGLVAEKLQQAVAADNSIDGEIKQRADELVGELRGGADFAELAEKHSDDPSAAQGGDLGFFGRGKMVPEFEKAAFSLEEGKISDPVKTEFGYHIIQVTEKRGEEVKARHILLKTRDFQTWLSDLSKGKDVHRYIKTPSVA